SFARGAPRMVALLDRGLLLVDLATGEARRIGDELEVSEVHTSHDGSLVAASTRGPTYVFDWDTGERRLTLPGHSGRHTVAVSRDGRLVATGGSDRIARLWSVADGRLIATLAEHRGPIADLNFDPSGERLATVCGDGAVRIYSATGALLAEYEGHAADALTLAWSPDGEWLASGGADSLVKIWPGRKAVAEELAGGG